MKEQLISFDTAKLSKEKGFNNSIYGYYINQNRWFFNEGENCFYDWDYEIEAEVEFKEATKNLIPRPSQSLLSKWLREEHNIHIEILLSDNQPWDKFYYRIMQIGKYFSLSHDGIYSSSYEESLEIGLQKALELI